MNEKIRAKLERICILNDFQREHLSRNVTVYGFSQTDGVKEYVVDSLLKALAVAVGELGQSSMVDLGQVDVMSMSDEELLNMFPYQFTQRAIILNGLAVWNYE